MAMKREIKTKAFVSENGQLILPRLALQGVAGQFSGRDVFVHIEDAAGKRTPNQNGYYHAAIVERLTDEFNDLGERFDTKMVHEILKYKFLKITIFNEDTAEVLVEYVRSTADLKVYEMSFYIEDCIRYAAEDMGVTIDPPRARRTDYIFPIFPKTKEPREKYVERVRSYVADVFTTEHLQRFFNQNEDWKTDDDIRAVFNARHLEINKLKTG